jgi:hypothetical protein
MVLLTKLPIIMVTATAIAQKQKAIPDVNSHTSHCGMSKTIIVYSFGYAGLCQPGLSEVPLFSLAFTTYWLSLLALPFIIAFTTIDLGTLFPLVCLLQKTTSLISPLNVSGVHLNILRSFVGFGFLSNLAMLSNARISLLACPSLYTNKWCLYNYHFHSRVTRYYYLFTFRFV